LHLNLIELYIRIGKGEFPLLRGSAHGSKSLSKTHKKDPTHNRDFFIIRYYLEFVKEVKKMYR